MHRLGERAHRQTRGVAGAAAGGQHVVGPGAVVAEGGRGVVADEDRSGVADAGGDGRSVAGLDLQVLRGVGVAHLHALVEVVDQHDAGLGAAQGDLDALDVPGGGDLLLQLGLHVVGQRLGVGDQHGRGQRVVLGLGDQVSGDVRRIGGLVGKDRDLGRAGLGVDADQALEQALGGDDPDVAGAGDQVDLGARAGAVGEHRDRLGTADGVDLLDAEQRARRQDRGVRQAAELLLRRARERQRRHTGHLGGHDVHQHAGDQGREAAGDVETHTADGHLAVHDARARAEVGDDVLLELGLAGHPQAADGLLEPGADGRVELLQRAGHLLDRHPDVALGDAVELLRHLQDRLEAAGADLLADRMRRRDRCFHVEVRTRQGRPVVERLTRRAARGGAAQVDPANHGAKSTSERWRARTRDAPMDTPPIP